MTDEICEALGWSVVDGYYGVPSPWRSTWNISEADPQLCLIRLLPLSQLPLEIAKRSGAEPGTVTYDMVIPYLSKRLEMGI